MFCKCLRSSGVWFSLSTSVLHIKQIVDTANSLGYPSRMHVEPQVRRLDEMAVHQSCVVHEIEASDDEMERLMSMGVCRGRIVTLIQRGDPLILKVFGSRLGVSSRLARRVLVACCAEGGCSALAPPLDARPNS